jgi:hypothetical protein
MDIVDKFNVLLICGMGDIIYFTFSLCMGTRKKRDPSAFQF